MNASRAPPPVPKAVSPVADALCCCSCLRRVCLTQLFEISHANERGGLFTVSRDRNAFVSEPGAKHEIPECHSRELESDAVVSNHVVPSLAFGLVSHTFTV
jgi:hypothetical protein